MTYLCGWGLAVVLWVGLWQLGLESPGESTYRLAPDAVIVVDGKLSKVADIPIGATVRVSLDNHKRIVFMFAMTKKP